GRSALADARGGGVSLDLVGLGLVEVRELPARRARLLVLGDDRVRRVGARSEDEEEGERDQRGGGREPPPRARPAVRESAAADEHGLNAFLSSRARTLPVRGRRAYWP